MLSSSSVLLLSDPSSCSSPGFPACVSIHDLLELEGYYRSDLLITLESIIIPNTHLHPAVHLHTVIRTSPINISLCFCESFRNSGSQMLYDIFTGRNSNRLKIRHRCRAPWSLNDIRDRLQNLRSQPIYLFYKNCQKVFTQCFRHIYKNI